MRKLKHLFMLCLFGMISIAASAIVYSGPCGANAQWSLDTTTGLLSITGSGDMKDYDNPSYVPWYSYHNDIISLSIGDQITSIGNNAFSFCSGLTSVTIPNSVTSIGDKAFASCTSLSSLEIPNSVSVIGRNAFSSTGWYKNQSNGLLYLNNCLIGYKGDKPSGTISINEETRLIANNIFEKCTTLKSIMIPNSITRISDYAFSGCSGLTSIEIPNSVTSIGKSAFYDCKGLNSIEIPNSVTSIGDYAFNGCILLESVTNRSTIPQNISSGVFSKYGILHVLKDSKDAYSSADNWNKFTILDDIIIPNIIIVNADDTNIEDYLEANTELLMDDNIKGIEITEQISDVNVTYTRNFEKDGVWQGWYMPFNVAFDDMKDAYDVAQIHGVLLDKDNNAVLAFLKLDKGTVNANTPFVVRPKKSGEVAITTTTDLLPTQSNSFLMMSATDKYTIGGVYEQTTTPGNWYALNLDGQFQLMGSGVYLRPFRIYMTIDPRTDNPYAQSATTTAKMDIVVIGDDETTGITSYENPSTGSGQAQNDNIYNLNGQRVTSIKSGQIYIMNGKKYIAK